MRAIGFCVNGRETLLKLTVQNILHNTSYSMSKPNIKANENLFKTQTKRIGRSFSKNTGL